MPTKRATAPGDVDIRDLIQRRPISKRMARKPSFRTLGPEQRAYWSDHPHPNSGFALHPFWPRPRLRTVRPGHRGPHQRGS